MQTRFYIRVHRRDGTITCSSFFDTLEEADRWRQTVRLDPVVLFAVIVQVEADRTSGAPATGEISS